MDSATASPPQPPAQDTGGWFDWLPTWDDAKLAASEGAARGIASGVFGPGYDVIAGPPSMPDDIREQQAIAAAQGPDYCDRTTVIGRLGGCEARELLNSTANALNSPVLTFAAGAVAIGVGTVAILAVSNAVGLTPVLQEGGKATARAIRGTVRAVAGGR